MHFSKSVISIAIITRIAAASSLAGNWNGSCKPAGLHFAAKVNGKYYGAAISTDSTSQPQDRAILDNHSDFGQVSPENAMKWDQTEPDQNRFDFTQGDMIADFASNQSMVLRCHTLVWYQALPSWVTSGTFDNATLTNIMTNHITNVVQYYKGRCYSWDVVNEALNDDGSFRDNIFYSVIGESYIAIAFAAAAAADPNAKLYYNDYNLENSVNNAVKIAAAQRMVDVIRASGARIDGVGFQSHFQSDISVLSVDLFTAAMRNFVDKDLEVAITELDVTIGLPTNPNSLQRQQWQYTNAITTCKNVDRCAGVTTWNFSDKYYFNTIGGNLGSALPWDNQLRKKLGVYSSIMSGWGGRGGSDGWDGWPSCSTKRGVVFRA